MSQIVNRPGLVPIAFALVLGSLAGIHAQGNQAIPADAARLLAAARVAVGIKPGTPGPSSLRLTGKYGDRNWPVEIEIVFPDRYVEVLMTGPFELRRGLNRTAGFGRTIPRGANAVAGQPAGGPGWAETWRRNFTALALGLLARTDTMPGLTIRTDGPTSIRVEGGPAGQFHLSGVLSFEPTSHLPVRFVATQQRPDGSTEEIALSFADRRDVAGLKLPFHLTRMRDGANAEEWRFDTIDVNPTIPNEVFQ